MKLTAVGMMYYNNTTLTSCGKNREAIKLWNDSAYSQAWEWGKSEVIEIESIEFEDNCKKIFWNKCTSEVTIMFKYKNLSCYHRTIDFTPVGNIIEAGNWLIIMV